MQKSKFLFLYQIFKGAKKMRIVLSSDGIVELLRGERVRRGQDLSRRIYVEWNENESPIDTGQILADNMAVQLCITRPDGEQSGWYSMIKIDFSIKNFSFPHSPKKKISGKRLVVCPALSHVSVFFLHFSGHRRIYRIWGRPISLFYLPLLVFRRKTQ